MLLAYYSEFEMNKSRQQPFLSPNNSSGKLYEFVQHFYDTVILQLLCEDYTTTQMSKTIQWLTVLKESQIKTEHTMAGWGK